MDKDKVPENYQEEMKQFEDDLRLARERVGILGVYFNPFPENRDHVKIVTQNDGYDFDCLALGIHCV